MDLPSSEAAPSTTDSIATTESGASITFLTDQSHFRRNITGVLTPEQNETDQSASDALWGNGQTVE